MLSFKASCRLTRRLPVFLGAFLMVLCLFQPLCWQHPYVPVLARGMLDFVMAPTAFLMGCHLSHFDEVAAVSVSTFQDISVKTSFCDCICFLCRKSYFSPLAGNQ